MTAYRPCRPAGVDPTVERGACRVVLDSGQLILAHIAVMRADANGEIVKWPIVAKAWFRGPTKERRDWMHDYIANVLVELGNKTTENILSGSEEPMGLYYAMEGTFSVAKARGLISKYIIDERLRIGRALWASR
jgi:hypothetical protein